VRRSRRLSGVQAARMREITNTQTRRLTELRTRNEQTTVLIATTRSKIASVQAELAAFKTTMPMLEDDADAHRRVRAWPLHVVACLAASCVHSPRPSHCTGKLCSRVHRQAARPGARAACACSGPASRASRCIGPPHAHVQSFPTVASARPAMRVVAASSERRCRGGGRVSSCDWGGSLGAPCCARRPRGVAHLGGAHCDARGTAGSCTNQTRTA
jgi:hypothetical protein